MSRNNLSQDSIMSATRSRANFSGHGNSKGAGGFKILEKDSDTCDFLGNYNDSLSITPPKEGFDEIMIGCEWDNIAIKTDEDIGFFRKFLKKAKNINKGVDIDLGCLYEMKNGERGAIQALGNMHGNYNEPPYIQLSKDERTGDKEGYDEYIKINGKNWDKIKRILIYVYIYEGAVDWGQVKPQVQVMVPNEKPMVVTLDTKMQQLDLCVIASIENIRGGIKLTNSTEYFPGHEEMDRAFGYGLEWDDGIKQ